MKMDCASPPHPHHQRTIIILINVTFTSYYKYLNIVLKRSIPNQNSIRTSVPIDRGTSELAKLNFVSVIQLFLVQVCAIRGITVYRVTAFPTSTRMFSCIVKTKVEY